MNPKFGGDLINHQFIRENGNNFNSVEERTQAMRDWFIKYTADPQNVSFLQTVAKARMFESQMPELIKAISANKEKTMTQNSKGTGLAPNQQNKTRTNPSEQHKDPLDAYFYDHV